MKNFQTKSIDSDHKGRELQAPSVTEYMTPKSKLITFNPDNEVKEVIKALLANRISGAPVLNDKGEVVGLIDDKDCLKVLHGAAYYNEPSGKGVVKQYMSNVMRTITAHVDVVEVADIFLQSPYKRLMVLDDDGRLLGQISRRDILRAIKDLEPSTW